MIQKNQTVKSRYRIAVHKFGDNGIATPVFVCTVDAESLRDALRQAERVIDMPQRNGGVSGSIEP